MSDARNPAAARADRKDVILDAVAGCLAEQKSAVVELESVIRQSGLTMKELNAEFSDLDELLVALVKRFVTSLTKHCCSLAETTGARPLLGVGSWNSALASARHTLLS